MRRRRASIHTVSRTEKIGIVLFRPSAGGRATDTDATAMMKEESAEGQGRLHEMRSLSVVVYEGGGQKAECMKP